MSDTTAALNEFMAVTSCNRERAKFFIEAAGGDLQLAIEQYFETGGQLGGDGDTAEDELEDEKVIAAEAIAPPISRRQQEAPKVEAKKSTQNSNKIFTFSSFGGDDSDENSDEEKGQAFYAGGSEHSGQQILGPPRQKSNPEKLVSDLFKQAREHGAVEVASSEESGKSSRGASSHISGYRLGDGSTSSEHVPAPSKPKQPAVRQLKLWKNGFTVDDGALRGYDDASNRDFLMSIQRGEPPRELLREAGGAEVHVDMQDHRSEDYEAPKEAYKLYNTEGYKLGSPTPKVISNASPNDMAKNEDLAKLKLNLDASQPTTQIQVRLSDGSRMVIKCNQKHKISDVRSFIKNARPEYSTISFALMTSFPNKEINNENETLLEAKLLNSVLIQKLK